MKWAARHRARLRARLREVLRAARGAWKGEPYFQSMKPPSGHEMACVYVTVSKSLLDDAAKDSAAADCLIDIIGRDFEKRGRSLTQNRIARG